MKKQSGLSAALALCVACAALLGSCDKGPEEGSAGARAVSFTAGIDGMTRTADGGDGWVAGDSVGIYMLTAGGTIPGNVTGGAGNVRYDVTDAGTGALVPNSTAIFYPQVGNVDFVAYYPYGTPAAGQLAVDLTDQSDPADIDVLTAKAAGLSGGAAAPVSLTFRHALSKITIKIKGNTADDQPDVAAIAAADITLAGIPGSATVTLDGGAAAAGANAAAPVAMNKSATAATGYDATFTAIVAPHGARGGRQLTAVVDGNPLTWDIPADNAFDPGNNYVYDATVGNARLSVGAATITPWTDVDSGPLSLSGQNHRITWDASTGRYTLTVDPADAGLYFKFGSVVGIYSDNAALHDLTAAASTDTYDLLDVAWHPFTTLDPITADWNTVPVYTAADFALSPNTVTSPTYHNVTNVKAGKGDPCRLVGLDLDKIKNTTAASLTDTDIDNRTWRLPTNADNQSFSGYSVSANTADHWTTLGGVPGGMFPSTGAGSSGTFLPAAGRRTNVGAVDVQGTIVGYWSSEPASAANGYDLGFNMANVYPTDNYFLFAYGLAVRCVRQ